MTGKSHPPEVKIRLFRDADIAPLHRLILATIDASYASIYPPRAIAFFKRFHGESDILERAADGIVLVAEQKDDLIATGSLVGEEMLAVFVHPRFQRLGLGKMLTSALERRAQDLGLRQLTLSVSLTSKAFYRNLGYELDEDCSRDVGEGQRLDFFKARKTLKARSTS